MIGGAEFATTAADKALGRNRSIRRAGSELSLCGLREFEVSLERKMDRGLRGGRGWRKGFTAGWVIEAWQGVFNGVMERGGCQ